MTDTADRMERDLVDIAGRTNYTDLMFKDIKTLVDGLIERGWTRQGVSVDAVLNVLVEHYERITQSDSKAWDDIRALAQAPDAGKAAIDKAGEMEEEVTYLDGKPIFTIKRPRDKAGKCNAEPTPFETHVKQELIGLSLAAKNSGLTSVVDIVAAIDRRLFGAGE